MVNPSVFDRGIRSYMVSPQFCTKNNIIPFSFVSILKKVRACSVFTSADHVTSEGFPRACMLYH